LWVSHFVAHFPILSSWRSTSALHEVKYDGYRLRVERDGDRVRLITLLSARRLVELGLSR